MKDEYGESGGARPWDGFLPPAVRPLDSAELGRFADKRILITGAGGYLGSALARALAPLTVQPLVLLDHAEYGLYRLEQELTETTRPHLLVGSVLDRSLLDEIFQRHAPQLVLHAAALKHVPLMEENPLAAAEANVLGTDALIRAAQQTGVERFLLLSTDKAVDPINVMGATKRIAEQIVLCRGQDSEAVFTVARLCNVLGSTGSVAPLFARQVAGDGPVTLTRADATRFFLSREDAVRFLLRSAVIPERSGLVIPPLDRPHRVKALAEYLVRQAGKGAEEVPIAETGLRPGDKLHERLTSPAETMELDATGTFLQLHSNPDRNVLEAVMDTLRSAVQTRNVEQLMEALRRAIPSYTGPQMFARKREGA